MVIDTDLSVGIFRVVDCDQVYLALSSSVLHVIKLQG